MKYLEKFKERLTNGYPHRRKFFRLDIDFDNTRFSGPIPKVIKLGEEVLRVNSKRMEALVADPSQVIYYEIKHPRRTSSSDNCYRLFFLINPHDATRYLISNVQLAASWKATSKAKFYAELL